jgi:anti-sigma regulatory factor (Ser/Thr protein kinase)
MAGLLPVAVTWLMAELSGKRGRRSGPPGPGPGGPDAPGAGPVTADQGFDSGSLHAVRAAVAAAAAAVGLPRARAYEAVAAVHELAANAVRHGGGRGRLQLWTSQDQLHCQVSDDGTPGGGTGPDSHPPWPSPPGHGLWLARQVADHAAISHGPAGTTATVSFQLPGQAPRRHQDQPG